MRDYRDGFERLHESEDVIVDEPQRTIHRLQRDAVHAEAHLKATIAEQLRALLAHDFNDNTPGWELKSTLRLLREVKKRLLALKIPVE